MACVHVYPSLVKECPWAKHFTILQSWGWVLFQGGTLICEAIFQGASLICEIISFRGGGVGGGGGGEEGGEGRALNHLRDNDTCRFFELLVSFPLFPPLFSPPPPTPPFPQQHSHLP